MKTLNELFVDELADMYDAEHRILKALPKLAKAAANGELTTLAWRGSYAKALGEVTPNGSKSNGEAERGRAKRPAAAGRKR